MAAFLVYYWILLASNALQELHVMVGVHGRIVVEYMGAYRFHGTLPNSRDQYKSHMCRARI